ncbi:MAG: alpha/beta hydrolase [Sphingomonadales bacterium]|nr:alpha/beta hydrolase [Sphingomonadales bacterium]
MPAIKRGNAEIYYEIHGEGDPVVCVGGWGSFCHGETNHLPWGLVDRHKVIILDYRGLGDSTDDTGLEPSLDIYADDIIAILDHLELTNVHMLGMVGMGACLTQLVCIKRPDLARSMINTGGWATVDRHLEDHLSLFLDVHKSMGFLAFQRLVSIISFEEDYYNKNIGRLLGEDGVWHHLNGNVSTHQRFVEASVKHDVLNQLKSVETPALIVHAPLDAVTGLRTTKPIEEAMPNARGFMLEGAAHVIAGKALKQEFARLIQGFYASI